MEVEVRSRIRSKDEGRFGLPVEKKSWDEMMEDTISLTRLYGSETCARPSGKEKS